MLRRDLLKFIVSFPFLPFINIKKQNNYAAYTIPFCNKIPTKIIIGEPIILIYDHTKKTFTSGI